MDRDHTINRGYGQCGEVPNVLAPLQRGSPLKVFMRRVDWMWIGAIAAFVLVACLG